MGPVRYVCETRGSAAVGADGGERRFAGFARGGSEHLLEQVLRTPPRVEDPADHLPGGALVSGNLGPDSMEAYSSPLDVLAPGRYGGDRSPVASPPQFDGQRQIRIQIAERPPGREDDAR